MTTETTLIEDVLKKNSQDIAFEPIPEENSSPLAQAVIQKPVTPPPVENTSGNNTEAASKPETGNQTQQPKAEEFDAPEQELNEKPEGANATGNNTEEAPEFEIPIAHATMAADTILGVANNILEIGAGYFVTIRKHKDFYDFDELIHVIEEQNAKNVKRIKLDEEDKALIRPLLIHMLRKKAKALTPEKQLLIAFLSIMVKKAKVMMEIRSENELLVDRIRDIIRKETGKYQEEELKEKESSSSNQNEEYEEVETIITEEYQHHGNKETGFPGNILETA